MVSLYHLPNSAPAALGRSVVSRRCVLIAVLLLQCGVRLASASLLALPLLATLHVAAGDTLSGSASSLPTDGGLLLIETARLGLPYIGSAIGITGWLLAPALAAEWAVGTAVLAALLHCQRQRSTPNDDGKLDGMSWLNTTARAWPRQFTVTISEYLVKGILVLALLLLAPEQGTWDSLPRFIALGLIAIVGVALLSWIADLARAVAILGRVNARSAWRASLRLLGLRTFIAWTLPYSAALAVLLAITLLDIKGYLVSIALSVAVHQAGVVATAFLRMRWLSSSLQIATDTSYPALTSRLRNSCS